MIVFKDLKWPDTWLGFVDLMSKTVLAATVAIVGFVYSHYQKQEDRRAAADAEARESLSDQRDAIGLFVQVMPAEQTDPRTKQKLSFLSAYCEEAQVKATPSSTSWWRKIVQKDEPMPAAAPALPESAPKWEHKVTATLCIEVGSFGQVATAKTSGAANSTAATALQDEDPLAYLQSDAAARFTVASAAAEAGAPATSDNWYAVIASVPVSSPKLVRPLMIALNDKLEAANLPVDDSKVYQTVISRSYAITSGGAKSEKDAKGRAAYLRTKGIPDAFAQRDRGWTKVDAASLPPGAPAPRPR